MAADDPSAAPAPPQEAAATAVAEAVAPSPTPETPATSAPAPETAAEAAAAQEEAAAAPSPEKELDALWQHVLDHWDEPKAHDLLVQTCFDRARLDFAAKRYKDASGEQERKAVADKRLASVLFLATQAMEAGRSQPVQKNNRWLVLVAALVAAASVALLLYAIWR